jgi:hypothetical protein
MAAYAQARSVPRPSGRTQPEIARLEITRPR